MKMTHPRYPKQTKEEFKVDAESAENWRDDLNNEEGSDWSSSDEYDLDDSGSESSESDADSRSTRMFRILLIDDGAGDSHRLVDNDASSNGNSISLAIAALASGISQQGVILNVASDILQLMARFEPSHGSACLTEPDRFLIPIVLFSEVGNCGSEAYSERHTGARSHQSWTLKSGKSSVRKPTP